MQLHQTVHDAEKKVEEDSATESPEHIENLAANFNDPPFTAEEQDLIGKALGQADGTLILSALGITLKGSDMKTLNPDVWVNDQIINFYLQLIMERGKGTGYTDVYCFNTFFLSALLKNGYDFVKKWTLKVDIFAAELVFVPVFHQHHWTLIVVSHKERVVKYLDSFHPGRPTEHSNQCLEGVKSYLQRDKKNKDLKVSYRTEHVENIPKQTDGLDCGVFICVFADYLSRKTALTFTQENIAYLRNRMVLEIIEMELKN